MIVRFKNRWIVPGFGRNRFQAGVVENVPDALEKLLPSTAERLTERELREDEQRTANEELLAADMARAAATGEDAEALQAAGFSTVGDALAEVARMKDASFEQPSEEEAEEQPADKPRGRVKAKGA